MNKLKINFWFLLSVFAVIFVSATVTSILFVKSNGILNKKLTESAETKRPANLDLIMITDATCTDCFNINAVLENIKKENTKFNSQKNVDRASEEGKQLIVKFAITKLPTFILTGELNNNPVLSQFFSKAGDTTDGTFVFRQVSGPYVDVATNKVRGKLNMVLLTDITCTECYDVTQHETILGQFGMRPTSKVIDIKSSEGITLKNRYGIKLVPAFVLTGDVNEYPSFKTVWPEVGMIAYDGAYVFTKGVPFMGVYKNLTTNKVITPAPKTTN